MITLSNVKNELERDNPCVYRYAFNGSKWRRFELMRDVDVELSYGILNIPKGFLWDLSSVPSIFWWFMKPFGRFDLAYLVHDLLYQNKGVIKMADGKYTFYSREECDKIMFDFAKAIVGTNKVSLRNIDIYVRYYAVRIFGGIVWNKDKR